MEEGGSFPKHTCHVAVSYVIRHTSLRVPVSYGRSSLPQRGRIAKSPPCYCQMHTMTRVCALRPKARGRLRDRKRTFWHSRAGL